MWVLYKGQMSLDYLIQISPQPALFVWSNESIKGNCLRLFWQRNFFTMRTNYVSDVCRHKLIGISLTLLWQI